MNLSGFPRRAATRLCQATVLLVVSAAAMLPGDAPPDWDSPTMAQPSNPNRQRPWRSCQVMVHLPDSAPADLPILMAEANAQVSAVAHVNYVLGTTPSATTLTVRPVHRPTPLLTIGGSAAEADSTYIDGRRAGATIIIDLDIWARLPERGKASRLQLLIHELLHTAGVGHAQDSRSTMAPVMGSVVGITPDAARVAHATAPTECLTGTP